MDNITLVLLAGLSGGLIRGLAGYAKYLQRYKETPFKLGYFLFTVVVSGGVGFLAAWIVSDLKITFLGMEAITPAIGFVVGYAGGDMIENLYKIILKKPDFPNV